MICLHQYEDKSYIVRMMWFVSEESNETKEWYGVVEGADNVLFTSLYHDEVYDFYRKTINNRKANGDKRQ